MPLIWQYHRYEKSRVRKAFLISDMEVVGHKNSKMTPCHIFFLSRTMEEEMGRGISNYIANRAKRRVKNTRHNIMKVSTIGDAATDQAIYNIPLNHCEGQRPKVFPPCRCYLTKRFRSNLWDLKNRPEKLGRDRSVSNRLSIIDWQALYKRIKR